jgi:hypothetical protein
MASVESEQAGVSSSADDVSLAFLSAVDAKLETGSFEEDGGVYYLRPCIKSFLMLVISREEILPGKNYR